MEPLIVILAAGPGTRLSPITEKIPKGMVGIGGKSLVKRKIESLPAGIRKVALLKETEYFQPLEQRLKVEHGFVNQDLIYQDRLVSLGYMPEGALSTEELAYYISAFFRSPGYQGKFDPIIFVPVDTIVEGIDYLDLLAQHKRENADITMVMKEGFNRGSNTRTYTMSNGRFVAASRYLHPEWEDRGCPEDIGIKLEPEQKILSHEGTYVVGGRFSEMPLDVLGKCFLESDFTDLFRALKVVPYVNIVDWIDVRDIHNLELAVQKFGK